MTKGRKFAPPTACEGIWFRHRGEPGDLEGRLRGVTSTRDMLGAPFSAPVKPMNHPQPYKHREENIKTNSFSQHDNRHYFQDRGEYFGNGKDTRSLGRRLHTVDRRQHHTDETFLHHRSRNPTFHDYNPITATAYRDPGNAPIIRRRFPKIYNSSEVSDTLTNTTAWCGTPNRTSMHVLAISQEPFPHHNNWKYSFHGSHKVYPPYDRKKVPPVPNVLNRYGPDFATAPVTYEKY